MPDSTPQIITQHLIYDGTMFGVPCDGARNVESRPVCVPMGAKCSLRLRFHSPATFANAMPERAFDVAEWRFELRDRIGAEHAVLFATDEVEADDDHIDADMSGTLTDELAAALGERTVGEFPAMLSGYDSERERIVSVVFRLRVGNTTDDEAVPEGAESLYKQVQEAKEAATEADGKAQTALDGLAGKADLVNGKVPSSQLPSYVDDVLEFASRSAFPATGESGKIYVALDTNKTYRWSGSEYVMVGGDDPPVPVAPSTDPSAAGKPADAKATGEQLSGKASTEDATLTECEFTAWEFADGLHEAARENMRDSQGGPITVPTHLELRAEANITVCWIVGDGVLADFCSVSISADGTTAAMQNGMSWSTEIVPVGSALATRNAVTNYRLGPEYGPNAGKPLAPAGDYALKSEIPDVPVKAVKRNGTALTPDANGAVNVEVPTTAGEVGAANQTALAAAFTATTYAIGDLCTYNGLLYRCKSGYTATAQSSKPDADTTHWEAAVVAVILGGKINRSGDNGLTGNFRTYGSFISKDDGEASLHNGIVEISTDGAHPEIRARITDSELIRVNGSTETEILFPSAAGTIALVSQIPAVASETWTFTVDDGQGGTTTVTKNVAVYAAQGAGA